MNDHIKEHAKKLSKEPSDLISKVMEKYTLAILEEMADQLKARDRKISKLEEALKTSIAWQSQQLGDHGVKQLLDMIEDDN